jgi:hypothetical protein
MNKIEVSNCLNCTFRYLDEGMNYCALLGTPLPYTYIVNFKTVDWCLLLKEDYLITHKDKEKKDA